MKKLLPLYSLLCLLLINVGCSKDDNTVTGNSNLTNALILNSTATDIVVGDEILFTTRSTEEIINGAKITELSKGIALTTNKWKATEVGTFTFKASKDGYQDSGIVTVHVKEKLKATGTGSFISADKEYKIESAKLLFRKFDDEGRAVWNLELLNYTDNIGVNLRFVTPSTYIDSTYKAVYPTTENTTHVVIAVVNSLQDDDFSVISAGFLDVDFAIQIDKKSTGFDAVEVTCSAPKMLDDTSFTLSYKGELETVGLE